jgi:hypothetical protein
VPLFDDVNAMEEEMNTSVRMKRSVAAKLDDISRRETQKRKASGKRVPGISRNDVIEKFLDMGIEAYAKEAAEGVSTEPSAKRKVKK